MNPPSRRAPPGATGRPHQGGLTLIELLVALSIMAALSVMAWRGLDTLATTEAVVREQTDAWAAWQTSLAQWNTDLDRLQDTQVVPPLLFDGQLLRLVRRAGADTPAGLQVVAWALLPDPLAPAAGTRWYRWSSPPLQDRAALENAWAAAAQWARAPTGPTAGVGTALPAASAWQLYYHRGGAWSHPLSASGGPGAEGSVPDAIRLVLTLDGAGPARGRLTRDWVRPDAGHGQAG
ncbi:prepilin-type N-terminal cleavage/methylation domain-containing protein [Aquabacterium sp. A08]|uniref:PulJ/GspJ family protein n=1 Tax=Aquabacterium sp. A08 TaxID=2718532 RepID=UPI001422CD60|nr:prepilin-type N-terminal cleavage/methylation domain-containing protein [Aquabacterium sp. A08]